MQSVNTLFIALFTAAIASAVDPTVEFMNVPQQRRAEVTIPLNVNTSLSTALQGTPIQYGDHYLAIWVAPLRNFEDITCNITFPDIDNRFFIIHSSKPWTSLTVGQNTIELDDGMIRCESSQEDENTNQATI
ncbi:unnamed protein product [Diplocarpon coronariae]